MRSTTYEDLLENQLRDDDFRREYETIEEEFALATEVIALRRSLDLTQKELANQAGTSQPARTRRQLGRARPPTSLPPEGSLCQSEEMDDVSTLVTRTRDGDLGACATLVERFQDMAYGYGYSLLGDFHLAQDAAQEAFVEAFGRLSQLRDPAAFPGWLRRVVFKHCDRITRGRRLPTSSLDTEVEAVSADPGPAQILEKRMLRDQVLAAIRALPPAERAATSLYYIDGYSQKEVGEFLGIKEKTVKSRLYRARGRLKERMIGMIDDAMKQRPLPEGFAAGIARLVSTPQDLDGARRLLAGSWHGKRQPESFGSVQAAEDARIYVVNANNEVVGAGYYHEMNWGIGTTPLVAARPKEYAGEAAGIPDPVFARACDGGFALARERGRAIAVVHGSMFDHGFCGFVPSFYYCVASLPASVAIEAPSTARTLELDDPSEIAAAEQAVMRDPFSAKISAFLDSNTTYAVQQGDRVVGYYHADPRPIEEARQAGMRRPFGYVSGITVQTRDAAMAVIRHAARIARDAGEDEILILESHETLVTRAMCSLGGTYLMRHSCPLPGLDAEMVAIIDLVELTRQLEKELESRLREAAAPPGSLSLEMAGEIVGIEWDEGSLRVTTTAEKVHRILPRWVVTRLYQGYYSGEDVLRMGDIPDDPGLDGKSLELPEAQARIFRALFPRLWPCSLPDPDVWPWVLGEDHPRYQHEEAKSAEMKRQIDSLRFPWLTR